MLNHISILEESLLKLKTPSFLEVDFDEDDFQWDILDSDEQDYLHCGYWSYRHADKRKRNIHVITPTLH